MKLALAFLLCASAWGANFACVSSGAGNWNDSSKWTSCNSTYPNNGGGNLYTATVNHAIAQNGASIAVGLDNGPVNGYVASISGSGGSGYANCATSISGGTAIRAATAYTRILNGACYVILADRGNYSAGTPTLGAITTTAPTATGASTVKGATTTLTVSVGGNGGIWAPGSTQSITISGATGTGWTALNASWTATVLTSANSTSTISIPLNSSGFSGTPGGTIAIAPGTAASYSLTYQAGGGTPAITVGTAGTLTLGPSTSTTISGDIQCASAFANVTNCLVWNGTGATSASPTTLTTAGSYTYAIGVGTNTVREYRTTRTSGCTQNGSDPSQPGNCKFVGNASHPARFDSGAGGAWAAIDGLYFKWVGDESSPAIYHTSNTGDGQANPSWSVINSLFDTSGRVRIQDNAGVSSTFDHNQFINTVPSLAGAAATNNLELDRSCTTPSGGVTYSLQRNSFDGMVGSPDPTSATCLKGYTVKYNFFGGGVSLNSGSAWVTWDTNFVRDPDDPQGSYGGASVFAPGGDVLRTYLWQDTDLSINPHSIIPPGTISMLVDGLIYGSSGYNTGDSGEVVIPSTGSAGHGLTVQNSVFLCDSTGVGASEIVTAFGTVTATGYTYSILHNTWCGGYANAGVGFSPVQLNEGSSTSASSITYKSNLVWSKSASLSMKTNSVGATSIADVCAAGACDYNGSYNLTLTPPACSGCANMGKGYQGDWTAVPGTHDVDSQNPNFLDRDRKLENFDQKYLSKPLSTAWSGGGTYAYGDLVSNTNASMYGGEALNYRCINLAGCTGLGAPGVPGTAWRVNWEFAAAYWVRLANYAGTQYTDSAISCTGCYVVQAVNNWITTGFTPQNGAYKGTAHDGGDIGAVVAVVVNSITNALFLSIP